MNKNLTTGKIVSCTNYDVFTRQKLRHLFVVWQSNTYMSDTYINNNVYAFRVTTNDLCTTNKVMLTQSKTNHLNQGSFVCVDSIFLLNAQDCVIIGQVEPKDLLEIIKARELRCSYELQNTLKTYQYMVRNS